MGNHNRATKSWYMSAIAIAITATMTMAIAEVPHAFSTGDTLTADDLNGNFAALDQKLTSLEARDPFAGTFPAVIGYGLGPWFCIGAAPTSLNVTTTIPGGNTATSHAFGDIIFTNGGIFAINRDIDVVPPELCNASPNPPTPNRLCSTPITFFLESPKAQTIMLTPHLDNAGAIYINGAITASTPTGPNNVSIPAGRFALTFLSCSTDGGTLSTGVFDAFLANQAYGLTVDYDRTFHRNGR